MAWNWNFWKRDGSVVLGGIARTAVIDEPSGPAEWEARLLAAGVSDEWAGRLADGLEACHRDLGRGSAVALIEGATLAVELQAVAHAEVERSLRDVREVERLLGAFSGELEKLDEVLEVLAAYAQRMRAKPVPSTRRVLH